MAIPKDTPKRTDGIETMARLMKQARLELAKNGVDNFDVEAVLERAEAARSSLYHHFGSKFDLIYTAQLEELVEGLRNDNQLFRYLVESASSEVDFFAKLSMLVYRSLEVGSSNDAPSPNASENFIPESTVIFGSI